MLLEISNLAAGFQLLLNHRIPVASALESSGPSATEIRRCTGPPCILRTRATLMARATTHVAECILVAYRHGPRLTMSIATASLTSTNA